MSLPAELAGGLASEFGKERLGKPYKEAQEHMRHFGGEEVRVQLRP